jgi:hypothetical protein
MNHEENKTSEKDESSKTSGDAKGKASFDQNGEGAAPKYGQAGEEPNESGEGETKKESED